jgi:hypothetical protein
LLHGDWQAGDSLLLATDALAQWVLGSTEEGNEPWIECLRIKSQQQFEAWIQKLRDAKEIRNDDAALVVIDSVSC